MVTNKEIPRAGHTPPQVHRQPLSNRLVLALLQSPLRHLLDGGTMAIRYPALDGHQVTLPVGYSTSGHQLIVVVGRSSSKHWWRHFLQQRPIDIWWHGSWHPTTAQAFSAGTSEHADAAAAYSRRHPRVSATNDPVVLITVPPITAAIPKRASSLWRQWTAWVTLGEFLGFAVPGVTGALLGDLNGFTMAALMVGAGAIEGALLGTAQAHVLHRAIPSVPRYQWIVATSAAAALAWSIGLLPALTDGFSGMPVALLIPVVAVLGTVLLASIGTAQWLVLRSHVSRSAIWILTTAGAWAAGLIVFTGLTTPLWQPGQQVALIAAIGILGGLLMAATVAALTGWALLRLHRRATGN